MSTLRGILGPMRLPFLILTPACVAVGVGAAYSHESQLNWLQVVLVFVGALASHICVNAFNEYFDFKSGLDATTVRTPFSGGSGTLPAQPELASSTLWLSLLTLALAGVIGLYFVSLRGWSLLPLGIFGLFLVVSYTTWWTHHPLLCLLAPGMGFGVLMVMGADFALTGEYSSTAFWASLMPTFLVSNLLLLNQFPDVEADKRIGRKHFPITIGLDQSAQIYGLLLCCAYIALLMGAVLGKLPALSLLALLTAPLAWKTYRGVRHSANDIASLTPFMGMNVALNIVTPVLLAFGLFFG